MKMKKLLTAAAAASLALFALVGCGGKDASSGQAEAKDYAQIIHDARTDEVNEAMLILSSDAEGNFTATDGPVADMTEDDIKAQADNFILPMLGLEAGDYEAFAASVSTMNVRSYGVAIVKPAEARPPTSRPPWKTTSPASSFRWSTTWPTSTRSPRRPPSPPSPRARWCWSAARIPTPSSPPSKRHLPPKRPFAARRTSLL